MAKLANKKAITKKKITFFRDLLRHEATDATKQNEKEATNRVAASPLKL